MEDEVAGEAERAAEYAEADGHMTGKRCSRLLFHLPDNREAGRAALVGRVTDHVDQAFHRNDFTRFLLVDRHAEPFFDSRKELEPIERIEPQVGLDVMFGLRHEVELQLGHEELEEGVVGHGFPLLAGSGLGSFRGCQ